MNPHAHERPESQGLNSTKRHVKDAQGRSHEVEFRQINHGHGVPTYGIVVDGKSVPCLDLGLYSKLLAFSDDHLVHYFFG